MVTGTSLVLTEVHKNTRNLVSFNAQTQIKNKLK